MKDAPLIDVGWLGDPTDLEVLVEAMKRARSLFESSAVAPILLGEEVLPGKNVTTDAQMADYIREGITTVYHASCTCKYCPSCGHVLGMFTSIFLLVGF
jgi:choline dehydrogenase